MYFSTMITFSILLCIIFLWIRWRKRRLTLFQRYAIPGPTPTFFFGNLLEFNKERDECIKRWLQQYGKTFGFYLGLRPYLVCADVEFLKLCQIKDANIFLNKHWVLNDAGIAHASYIDTLPLQTGKNWKDLRSVLSSSFSTGKIKMMSTLMSNPIKIFLRNLEKEGSQSFDIAVLCEKLIFDIVCRSAFGIETNVQNNENNIFIQSISSVLTADTADILARISLCFIELESICSFLRRKIDSLKFILNIPSMTTVYENCEKIVNSRKKLEQHSKDLLQAIIDAKDETVLETRKLLDKFVVANAMSFMVVGYDTTSVTLSWSIYYLARHPEIQEKVRQEINCNVAENMEIQYSDLSNFQLLNQVISETLRFRPLSLFVHNRLCSEDYHYKGMTIPKGCIITAPVQVLQNDPEYWIEPDRFDPERFSSSNRSHIDSITYQPFGAGPRNCIGQRFALTTIRLVLANLIRSFKLESFEDKEAEVESRLFVYHPKNGVHITATPLTS